VTRIAEGPSITIREGRFRLTVAKCPAGHHWLVAELFTHDGSALPMGERVIPALCDECRSPWTALVD